MEVNHNGLHANTTRSPQNGNLTSSTENENVRYRKNANPKSNLDHRKSKSKNVAKVFTSQPRKGANKTNKEKGKKEASGGNADPERKRRSYRDNRIAFIKHKILLESNKAHSNSISLFGSHTSTNVVLFVALFSMAMCLQGAVVRYIEGMLHQPEQKYYFTGQSSVICSVIQTAGLLCSLAIVVFFGKNAHKPFIIFIGLLLCSVGSMVWSIPFFIDRNSFEKLSKDCSNQTSLNYFYSEMCLKDSFRIDKNPLQVCSNCLSGTQSWAFRELRFFLICLGNLVIGTGAGLYISLGFLYIEENNKVDKSCFFYGIILSMMGLGQFAGSFLAWWLLNYDEKLSGAGNLKDFETRAWWLGTVLLSILFFILSWSFILFPKWISEPAWVVTERYETINAYNQLIAYLKSKKKKQKEIDPNKKTRERNKKTKSRRKSVKGAVNSGFENDANYVENAQENRTQAAPNSYSNQTFVDSPSGFETSNQESTYPFSSKPLSFNPVMTSTVEVDDPSDPACPSPPYAEKNKPKVSKKLGKRYSALRDLFRIPAYSLFLIAICLASYYLAAYRPISHVLVHQNYHYDVFKSWFYTSGLSESLAWMLGCFVGGLVVCKFRLPLRSQLIFMIISILFHCAFFFFIFALTCNPVNFKIDDYSSTGDCIAKYSCNEAQAEKVCVEKDGMLVKYPTPCHAACAISGNGSCNSFGISRVSCESVCPIFGAYWVLIFFASFSFSLPAVTVILMFIRTVDEENKTMALSTAFWLIKLTAFIPGRGIFDAIIMTTCTETKKNCLDEILCWAYSNDNLRHLLHGANLAFQAGAIFFLFLLLILAIKNIIHIDYQPLVSISFDGNPAKIIPVIRPKTGVDTIREVMRTDQVSKETEVVKKESFKEGVERSEVDRQLSTEDKLRRHLQAVEMQLEKQNSSKSSKESLNVTNINPQFIGVQRMASQYGISSSSLDQPTQSPLSRLPRFLSDKDLRRSSEESEDSSKKLPSSDSSGGFNAMKEVQYASLPDSYNQPSIYNNIDIL